MSETTRTMLDHARDALNARMTKDALHLVLENTITYAAALETERHSTNESLSEAAEQLRVDRDRITELEENLRALNAGWATARAHVAELKNLTAQATEFRLWEPGYGLYVRRAPGAAAFGVLEARRTDKGRRCWTTAGWQYSAVLSDKELFCWPDAQTAVAEARRVMPGAAVCEPVPFEARPLTVYRASHDSIVMGLYLTAAGARAHCEAEERRCWPALKTLPFDWIEDEEDGVAELVIDNGDEETETGYVVTALEVAAAYDEEADQ